MIGKINQYEDVRQLKLRSAAAVSECSSFSDVLNSRIGEEKLHFSKHATERVNQRGIDVTPSFLDDLQSAVEKARLKGAKDVVIISERGAFIVNVPNNTVVTTMSGNEMKENIFTNIDSAVLL
ncbi:TIGR02530 family flagellar biosynthesis protein [Clostridium boliviensis]|uniref:TIGR02530 family flagellar biosynthesis protein n=1 Tax=Clostridium boliviensis TaxID=318465 RepID=A0ABU4GKJ6_9CLOT|nr:TIGR02530 family flagellar biosynthesis protein [Clostridium boliviensis]MDW2798143.1 TIGR02530 family flagellar biosynthesis protein [Clostridium boliviensis]